MVVLGGGGCFFSARYPCINYFIETCSGSDAGSYLRRIAFVYHSTLGYRVTKKKREGNEKATPSWVHNKALGIVLLWGPEGALFVMREVPLHRLQLAVEQFRSSLK